MPSIHTNAHLSRTDDVVHKMSEISTYENHRSGVKYYWVYIGIIYANEEKRMIK